MRAATQTVLGVLILTGWFLALLWLVTSVAQIAVTHTLVRDCAATARLTTATDVQEGACWR